MLRFGGLFIVLAVMGCKGEVDAFVKADWVFENASSHKIEVISKNFNSFVIQPGESYTYSEAGEGPENIAPDNYVSPYGAGDKIIVDEGIAHILQKGESITDVQNFDAEKVQNNYYRFTYAFTDGSIQY